jgi:hypothetical protein
MCEVRLVAGPSATGTPEQITQWVGVDQILAAFDFFWTPIASGGGGFQLGTKLYFTSIGTNPTGNAVYTTFVAVNADAPPVILQGQDTFIVLDERIFAHTAFITGEGTIPDSAISDEAEPNLLYANQAIKEFCNRDDNQAIRTSIEQNRAFVATDRARMASFYR